MMNKMHSSNNLLKNCELWEELEDEIGEKISGGEIFRLLNLTNSNIDLTIFDGDTGQSTIRPYSQVGTETIRTPGNLITIQFDNDLSPETNITTVPIIFPQRGIFRLEETNNTIEFSLR